MTKADEYEALVEACARAASIEMTGWHPQPVSNDERARFIARAILAVIAEKAKEWPTEGTVRAWATGLPDLGGQRDKHQRISRSI